MMAAAVEDGFTVYYVTSRQSAKCRHLAVNPKASSLWTEVLDPMRDWRSVCIKGTAVVSDDKALRERFWVEELKPFFPGGVDDPNFVVIIVKPEEMILADQQTFPPQVVSL
jgi:general stress protein 26